VNFLKRRKKAANDRSNEGEQSEKWNKTKRKDKELITETMPSLAERTSISAQETTPGHSLSTASLMVSMYLKFLKPKLLSVSFSDKVLLVESRNSEASQLYPHKQKSIFLH